MKKAYIWDAVFNHGKTLNAETECKTLTGCRVDTGISKYFWMHHARTHNLKPFLLCREPHIHLNRGFREREVARSQSNLRAGTKILSTKSVKRPFQMRECDVIAYRKPFKLVELRLMRRVRRFVAEDFSRHDNPRRSTVFLEPAYLHRRRVCTQDVPFLTILRLHPKSVPHIARRMICGNIQGIKVVVLCFKLRPLHDTEAHATEYVSYLANSNGDWVQATFMVHYSKYTRLWYNHTTMSLDVLMYPFIFLAIFFESFVIVTLLSKPARAARMRQHSGETPTVAIIVPCWNEGTTVAATCESLLALDYPKDKLEIILVDDGSTDTTPEVMMRFADNPHVRIICKKENGGKHTAVNAGVAVTQAEFIGCLDADSFVEPDALKEIIPCFKNPRVAAVTAAMTVHNPKNILQHMQNAEYTSGIIYRHVFASINGLYVTPGPFSFYRHSTLAELGGFRYAHQTEDMEMALRIQRAGYEIENAPRARVYTKSPDTILKLVKQRTRWTTGFVRNVLGDYRDLIGSTKHGVLGMLILPTALVAIVSSMLLFFLVLFQLARGALIALEIRAGIPLSYALAPHGPFDWFYVPTSFFPLLGMVALLALFSFIIIGKYISRTPGKLVLGIISYTFLYGLIAPLWLMRTTADVTLGTRRGWRN